MLSFHVSQHLDATIKPLHLFFIYYIKDIGGAKLVSCCILKMKIILLIRKTVDLSHHLGEGFLEVNEFQ